MRCIHQQILINQGYHWYELQKGGYPNCDSCSCREEPSEYDTMTCTTNDEIINLEALSSYTA